MSSIVHSRRLRTLSRELRGPVDSTSPMELEVQPKTQELKSQLLTKRSKSNLPTAKALLCNYRAASMNPNQDANDGRYQHACALAHEYGFVIIRVAMGLPSNNATASDLDPYGVTFSKAKIIDKQNASSFWAEVSKIP